MKLLIISDTHIPTRNKMDLYDFLVAKEFDFLIHCGDFTNYASLQACQLVAKDRLAAVYGNCDPDTIRNEIPAMINFHLNDVPILLFHSFNVYPRANKEQLLENAMKHNSKIVFFGHSHRQDIFYYDKNTKEFIQDDKLNPNDNRIYFVNPGSLIDGNYLVLEI